MTPHPAYVDGSTPELQQILFGIFGVEDMESLDLFRHITAVAHLVSSLKGGYRQDSPLSAARMRLLIRLTADTEMGNTAGLSPSELSAFLGVGRNTVSALLNGLEEQALIERHLHPTDRRQFLIRITPAGQDTVHTRAPVFAAFVADLFSALSAEERATLLALLDKLVKSLVEKVAAMGGPCPAHALDAAEEA